MGRKALCTSAGLNNSATQKQRKVILRDFKAHCRNGSERHKKALKLKVGKEKKIYPEAKSFVKIKRMFIPSNTIKNNLKSNITSHTIRRRLVEDN